MTSKFTNNSASNPTTDGDMWQEDSWMKLAYMITFYSEGKNICSNAVGNMLDIDTFYCSQFSRE